MFLNAGSLSANTDDCLDAPYTSAETPRQVAAQDLVLRLRGVLVGFPSLLSTLQEIGPSICLTDRLGFEHGSFFVDENRIHLAEDLESGMDLAVLIHELRHVDQVSRGICPSPALSMRQFARAELALEADANAVLHLVGWEQRTKGNEAIWEALERWQMTADIAARFGEVMTETNDVASAASAAFEQWYLLEDRRERYFIASCSGYLDRQEETHALPSYLKISDDFLSQLCVLPDGGSYACDGDRPVR